MSRLLTILPYACWVECLLLLRLHVSQILKDKYESAGQIGCGKAGGCRNRRVWGVVWRRGKSISDKRKQHSKDTEFENSRLCLSGEDKWEVGHPCPSLWRVYMGHLPACWSQGKVIPWPWWFHSNCDLLVTGWVIKHHPQSPAGKEKAIIKLCKFF